MSTKEEFLRNYSNSINVLFRESKLNEHQFWCIHDESLAQLERSERCTHRRIPWRRFALGLLVAFCVGGARPAYRSAVCSLQEYIYPGLRLLRTISVPLVSLVPALTELYDETCLLQNPLFRVADMECWPCGMASRVLRVTRPDPSLQQHHSAPFIYKTKQQRVNVTELKKLYESNAGVFDSDAPKIIVNNKKSIKPSDMFTVFSNNQSVQSRGTYLWRINRMAPAQLIRKLISRPKVVPQMGQSTERYILIGLNEDYSRLPDPECNFAFLLQIKEDRKVELLPAKECASHCKPMSVLLKESYLLWYNWWYWRPVVQPSTTNETSVAYMGSYC